MSRSVEDRIEALLDDAEDCIDAGNLEGALEFCELALRLQPDHPGTWFVKGDVLRTAGALEAAAQAFRKAALGRPDHAACWSSLALTAFELLRFDEAAGAAARAIRADPHDADAWWVRSLVRQWRGDLEGARRAELHAHWLDPLAHPLPPVLTDEEVEELISDALRFMPDEVREYLADVAIILEEVPSAEACSWYDPPASPLELLGYFSGASLRDRSTHDPWSQLPGTIVLFRANLARRAADREELIDQLRITLFHEVGHFLGLDEDDLEDRGLD
ncbi:metallopeptidase family protein [Myxococcota bacterium]|nr:metallopeptidase family protein [Myxococcota bacterium]